MKTRATQIGPFAFEVFVTTNGVTFGFKVGGPMMPNADQIIQIWNQCRKDFWIEAECFVSSINGKKLLKH